MDNEPICRKTWNVRRMEIRLHFGPNSMRWKTKGERLQVCWPHRRVEVLVLWLQSLCLWLQQEAVQHKVTILHWALWQELYVQQLKGVVFFSSADKQMDWVPHVYLKSWREWNVLYSRKSDSKAGEFNTSLYSSVGESKAQVAKWYECVLQIDVQELGKVERLWREQRYDCSLWRAVVFPFKIISGLKIESGF